MKRVKILDFIISSCILYTKISKMVIFGLFFLLCFLKLSVGNGFCCNYVGCWWWSHSRSTTILSASFCWLCGNITLKQSFAFGCSLEKKQLIHPLLIDVIVVFSRVFRPINVQVVVFWTTVTIYDMYNLFVTLQCFADLLRTSPRLVINIHSLQLNCIKGKRNKRRNVIIQFETLNQNWSNKSTS